MKSDEVAKLAGITYRQLDWWVRQEHIHAEWEKGTGGSGYHRIFSPEEVRVVMITAKLVEDGITVGRAVEIARAFVANPKRRQVFLNSVTITLHHEVRTLIEQDLEAALELQGAGVNENISDVPGMSSSSPTRGDQLVELKDQEENVSDVYDQAHEEQPWELDLER